MEDIKTGERRGPSAFKTADKEGLGEAPRIVKGVSTVKEDATHQRPQLAKHADS